MPVGDGFGVDHLPYGVFSIGDAPPRVGVRYGDGVLDLSADDPALFAQPTLNPFLAAGPEVWAATRGRVTDLLGGLSPPALVPLASVRLQLPFAVADYVDFYSSLEHATNVGRLLRPDADPLPPNWRHLPAGYHGRAGTVVVSGTPVRRPVGQRPTFGPSERLDVELEVGWVAGPPSVHGEPVPIDRVGEHLFGLVLLNDWSARDLQAWESRPLGPFLGKSFATSIAAWVTPLAALEPFRVPGRAQDPPVLDHLRSDRPWGFDLDLELVVSGAVLSRVNFAGMYWTVAQQLAHLTSNGASIRTGDLYGSGTVSGPRGSEGSLLERGGGFLEDGDEVVMRGTAGGDGRPYIRLAEVSGRVHPARLP